MSNLVSLSLEPDSIPLPQFTFLCGPLGSGQISLMKALISRDDNLIRIDFTYPLQEFLMQLFPESCPSVLDPLDNLKHGILGYTPLEAQSHDYPQVGVNTIHDFLLASGDGLRKIFGPAALGILALRYMRQADIVKNFDRILFTDAINPADIEALTHPRLAESLCIHLGSLNEQNKTDQLPCRHIWLAHSDTASRLAQLQKDLTNDRQGPTINFSGLGST